MASGSKSKKNRPAAPVISRNKGQGPPWLTIAAIVAVLALVGGIFAVVYTRKSDQADLAEQMQPFVPTEENKDPSRDIEGIYIGESVESANAIEFTKYKAAIHIDAPQRVNYDRFPPVGGPHDTVWAACNGVVYDVPVRDESMVHPMEHGAVWVTYNPDTIADGDLAILDGLVRNKSFMTMSPYPTLDQPISLQSWGHQLKLDSASDVRVNQFITALLRNQYVYPEVGATCDQPSFNTTNPPAFDPSPRDETATPLDGGTIAPDTNELMSEPVDGSSAAGTTEAAESGAEEPEASGTEAVETEESSAGASS